MSLLCFQYKVVSIEYFMNELEEWQINDMIDCLNFADKNQWEMCRLNCYLTAQVNSTKKLKPKDVMVFPWEEEIKVVQEEPSRKEINHAREQAMLLASAVNSGNFETVGTMVV